MKYLSSIHVGTSGWGYKHWKNVYYPKDLKQADWLRFYAASFLTSEINTSFYHLPKITTTEKWKKEVPSGFMFCPKISRYITHIKKLNDAEKTMPRFFEMFKPLKRKTGPILVQLPASLGFHQDKTEQFYKVCKKQYAYYRFAMEVRHNSWLSHESMH